MTLPSDDSARAPEWLTGAQDPLSHAFATALTRIRPELADALAERILEQVMFHSAYRPLPAGFQFLLPNGALLTVYDQMIGGRRRLSFMSPRGPGKVFMPAAARAWPRGLPPEGAWFAWRLSDRKKRRLHKDVANAVEVAYANRDTERRPRTVLIDPQQVIARIQD